MRHATRGILFVLTTLLLVWPIGCQRSESDQSPEPDRPPAVEVGLRLTDEARASIGIATTPAQLQSVSVNFRTTGWLAVKPGTDVTVKAAATGFVTPMTGSGPLALGDTLTTGQDLGTLQVFVSPQEEAQLVALKEGADMLIRQSLATLEAAQARLERIGELSDSGVVAEKERQLAKETMERAKAAYEETQNQLPFLPTEPYERPLQLRSIAIKSPSAGRLSQLHVPPQQLVMQGDPLWTLSDWSSLWLRVPVFEGDLAEIARTEPAEMNMPGIDPPITITPTNLPQATVPGRRTVDLFYEVANADGTLRPGEAVAVSLPTGQQTVQIVVPRSAVLWDGMANTWVYLETEKNLFRRQRIQIGPTDNEMIVIERGLAEGESVVTVGAESLYGEEFKGQIEILEDDD